MSHPSSHSWRSSSSVRSAGPKSTLTDTSGSAAHNAPPDDAGQTTGPKPPRFQPRIAKAQQPGSAPPPPPPPDRWRPRELNNSSRTASDLSSLLAERPAPAASWQAGWKAGRPAAASWGSASAAPPEKDRHKESGSKPHRSWGRLKPVSIDPLDEYGLPSKGEKRLNNPKTQEAFYNLIVERYLKFCASHSETGDSLAAQFDALSIAGPTQKRPLVPPEVAAAVQLERSFQGKTAPPKPADPADPSALFATAPSAEIKPSPELEDILLAMRKLRESLTATRRTDEFAQRALVFIIRAGLLCSVPEAYHPALRALLGSIHSKTPLPTPEWREFTGYLILDRACRLNDLAGAQQVRLETSGYDDHRVAAILRALTRRDWVAFWRLWRLVDGYQRGAMAWGIETIRLHALKCLAKSYFSVDKAYLELVAGEEWERLRKFGLGWELEVSSGGVERVVIRRPRARAAPS